MAPYPTTHPVPSRPHVLHVLEALVGGTARHVVDVVRSVHAFEHTVLVPSQRHGDTTDVTAVPALREAGAAVEIIEMRRMPSHPDNLVALMQVRRVIRRRRPDLVHGHSSVGGALARLAAATSRNGPPAIWTPNGVLTAAPVVYAERLLDRLTTRTIAVSESEAALLVDRHIVADDRVAVIPNGIDVTPCPTPTPDLRQMLGIASDVPLVGSIGRLVPQKLPIDFAAACEEVSRQRPDVHFVCIGDGPLAAELQAHVDRWDRAGRFHRLDYVPAAGRSLGALDVFVLLSAYEGGPYAPLEAMRESVPVVVTDVVGNRDAVESGVTGVMVPMGDPAAAAAAIIRLLDEQSWRDRLVEQAGDRLRRVFSLESMGSAHSQLYWSVLRSASTV
jgi:glycosyltransferase involved in cell wall biosynthesis